jgi:hypothetical protein
MSEDDRKSPPTIDVEGLGSGIEMSMGKVSPFRKLVHNLIWSRRMHPEKGDTTARFESCVADNISDAHKMQMRCSLESVSSIAAQSSA